MSTLAPGLAWRARIGVLIPQLDHLTEPYLSRLLPPGISFHVSRMRRTGPTTPESLHGMNASLREAVELLPSEYLDLVVYHCTSGSLLYDPRRLVADLEAWTGRRAVTTTSAVLDALCEMNAHRICLVTPYPESINEAEVRFLEERGFTVTAVGGAHLEDSGYMQHVAPDEVSLWVRHTDYADSDAVFLSCTGIRAVEFVDELEADLGRPVITSTTAMLWSVVRKLGLSAIIPGCGRLLRGGAER